MTRARLIEYADKTLSFIHNDITYAVVITSLVKDLERCDCPKFPRHMHYAVEIQGQWFHTETRAEMRQLLQDWYHI